MGKKLSIQRETVRNLQASQIKGLKPISPRMKEIGGATWLCTPTPTLWESSVLISQMTTKPNYRASLRAMWRALTEVTEKCDGGGYSESCFSNKMVKCFAADTPIHTPEGLVSIQDIESGQSVWSWNEEKQQMESRAVEKLEIHPGATEVFSLDLDLSDRVLVTKGHPVLTEEGFLHSHRIQESTKVLFRNGTFRSIVTARTRGEKDVVYNVKLSKPGNYLVGQSGLVVLDR